MKYSYMLLITLVISVVWGLLLFILGCFVRFQQAMMLNRFLEGLDTEVDTMACEQIIGTKEINICAHKTTFDSVMLGDWANFLGSIIIVTGFLIILLSASGFVGVLKKSQILLLLMLVLIIVAIGLEYYILDIVLGSQGSFHEGAKEELIERIASEYTVMEEPNEFTQMLNAIMLQAECCGVGGTEDFHLNETLPYMGTTYEIQVPPSCCEREDFSHSDRQDGFRAILSCISDTFSVRNSQRGCYKIIHKAIYDKYGSTLIGFLLFLILWEGIQGILLFMIILRPAPKTPRKSVASSQGSGRYPVAAPTDVAKQKKFIPYSKVSTFVSSDINRIKSTEIW